MRMSGLLAGVLGIVLMGGCAGGGRGTQVKRLESQVALLDRRVSQLERAGGGWASPRTGSEAAIDSVGIQDTLSSPPGSDIPTMHEIQQALHNAGFYQGAVDGKRGPLTRQAVKDFQRVHGLKDDGIVGAQTWDELRAYADLPTGEDDHSAAEFLK